MLDEAHDLLATACFDLWRFQFITTGFTWMLAGHPDEKDKKQNPFYQ
jgi:hypothetical protein